MNILFLVVLPLVTILVAIVLQRVLRNPILVAFSAFAVYLTLAFTIYTTDFLINAILYTALAYIAAVLTRFFCCMRGRMNCPKEDACGSDDEEETKLRKVQDSIEGLGKKIESLENNIDHLTDVLSSAMGGTGSYSRRMR